MWWFSSGRSPIKTMGVVLALLCAGVNAVCPAAAAGPEVSIDIIKEPGRKVRVALPPFFEAGEKSAENPRLRDILLEDLRLSGFFQAIQDFPPGTVLDGRQMTGRPELYDKLVSRGVELLLNVHDQSREGKFILEGFVFDPATRQQIFGKRYRGPEWARIKMIHVLAGEIIQELTGVRPLTKSRLAFVWNISGKKQVFISDYDGRDPKPVSPAGELALFPEWLPDAQSLVYTSFVSGFPELVFQDVDNGHQKILTSYPGMNANVSFSPDGQTVLATLSKDGNPEIYKLNLEGKVLQRMTYDSAVDTSPSFAPDGREFAFVSDKSGGPQIYILGASGGKPTRVTFQGGYNVSPDWSPSGKFIAYCAMVEKRFQLMLLNPATGEVSQLTDGPGNKEDPDWGVDDRHLVFTLTKDFKSDLYMIDIYSKEQTQLTRGKGDFSSPSWSTGNP
jgi:TolB protein